MSEISRRQFLGGLGAAAVGAGGRRPNVLYVFSDMQRATSMGCYGDPNVRTPALDAFARQGARLDAAISNTPVCCPHRASLMTGLYGHHSGVVSNGVRFIRHARGIAEQFRDAGYITGYAGKWHIPPGFGSDDGMPLGFPAASVYQPTDKGNGNHYVRVGGKEVYAPTMLANRAIRFIEEKSRESAPWLFFLSWLPPHVPYAAPPECRAHYTGTLRLPPNVPDGPSKEFARRALPDYYGMVESLDTEFRRILDAVDRAGVARDTIVCYSSDHGDMIGSHGYRAKRWPHEESARVPFLVRYPRAIPAGRVIADPFSTVDVYPTLAALAGLKPPAGLDGADYSGVLTGRAVRPPRDYAYLEMMYAYVAWPGWRALRTREYSYARTVKGPWLLHNIARDPWQTKNLVEDPGSRALVAEMDRRLTGLMKENGDSWERRATTGDIELWTPGGPKQRSQNLGVPFPGRQAGGADGSRRRKKGGKRSP